MCSSRCVPPPQSAEIPLVDEQFSAGTNHRQLTLSYQVLPLKGRKAARYATRRPQRCRYRIERVATVPRLELTPLAAHASRNNNIHHRLMTKTEVTGTAGANGPGVSAGILGSSDNELSWPAGEGTPGFRVGRRPQACAQAAKAGRAYRGPAGPGRADAWHIPTPDPACGRVGAGATAAIAGVRAASAAPPQAPHGGQARPP